MMGRRKAVFAAGLLLLCAGFSALGFWQVQRLGWKQALIDRVAQRVSAAAVDAPGPQRWREVDAAGHEYRRVKASGTFLFERETLVQASTVRGPGFWVLTPLQLADGSTLLVNRGFVVQRPPPMPAREATVTGLLRISEPGGGFLRRNNPVTGRWYSRDVPAIAAARGLQRAAPFFIDADAGADEIQAGEPVGGMTVLAFRNHHLAYAITWFVLALMALAGSWRVLRD